MQHPTHVMMIERRRQLSPLMIAAISGAVVFDAAVIYCVATGLTFSGIRSIPHPIQTEFLQKLPPKVQPLVLQPQLVKPTTAAVPQPDIRFETPQPLPQISAGSTTLHPEVTAAGPPAPPKLQGITAPISIGGSHSCQNEYPPLAVRLNEQGMTTIKFTVNSDGSVSGVQIVHSSGYDALDKAAVRCASSWRYKPALENGHAVPASWATNVQWKLRM